MSYTVEFKFKDGYDEIKAMMAESFREAGQSLKDAADRLEELGATIRNQPELTAMTDIFVPIASNAPFPVIRTIGQPRGQKCFWRLFLKHASARGPPGYLLSRIFLNYSN